MFLVLPFLMAVVLSFTDQRLLSPNQKTPEGVTLLAVDGGTAGEILVPMVDAICRRIDVGQKVIEIVPVDGLLDLNVTGRRA